MKSNVLTFSLSILLACFPMPGMADDADELTAMLQNFLANASVATVHERFWADELIYTSSNGTRTSKAEIMQGFAGQEPGDTAEPGPVYSAEDIQIRLFGTTAIVAFRLVATPVAGDQAQDAGVEVKNYFNTGTFLNRNGRWQVVAWQATVIP